MYHKYQSFVSLQMEVVLQRFSPSDIDCVEIINVPTYESDKNAFAEEVDKMVSKVLCPFMNKTEEYILHIEW